MTPTHAPSSDVHFSSPDHPVDDVLVDIEPRHLWQCFDGIRHVPRPSKHEERIVAHVERWAGHHGFTVRRDDFGNRVVQVPASAGREGAETVVLQTHLDMVCEKNAGVEHDFMQDPIRLRRDGDWIGAVGTTLGADNGLGAAAAMAVAEDPAVEHGPLELLFTLEEEIGLNGAAALDGSIVTGRTLINLDTEEDTSIYIGCAGAAGVQAKWGLARSAAQPGSERLELSVTGLLGGHSGVDIHRPRGNAIKIMARLLRSAVEQGLDVALISFHGGSKGNALPRECFAHLRLPSTQRGALEKLVEASLQEARGELGSAEPGLEIHLEAAADGADGSPLVAADRDRLLGLFDAVHHGVWSMSSQVPGLVETSCNLAVVRTEESRAWADLSVRSSSNEALRRVTGQLLTLCRLSEAEGILDSGYPGWTPEPESPLVRSTAEVYETQFGQAADIKAVHAGLECGLLGQRLPGLKAVSIGPNIRGAHSPDEEMSLSSAARFYGFLGALLETLSRP